MTLNGQKADLNRKTMLLLLVTSICMNPAIYLSSSPALTGSDSHFNTGKQVQTGEDFQELTQEFSELGEIRQQER